MFFKTKIAAKMTAIFISVEKPGLQVTIHCRPKSTFQRERVGVRGEINKEKSILIPLILTFSLKGGRINLNKP
jgi:hypothetical protein